MSSTIDIASTVYVPPDGLEGSDVEADVARRLTSDARIERVLIPASIVHDRVDALAAKIAVDCADRNRLAIVVVLGGGFAFAKDLGERLFVHGGPELSYYFLKVSTYGTDIKGEDETERPVVFELEPRGIDGCDVLVVEDLVDQAFTLTSVRRRLLDMGARSVRLCVLLGKQLASPTARVRELRESLLLDYVGFRVPDVWVAGYGTDAGGDFRNLPCIVEVDRGYYERPMSDGRPAP